MALSDIVAAQIMGELYELTKKIETQQAQTAAVAKAVAEQISRLPGAADREMLRAGESVLAGLAGKVAEIAQRVAGDAAAAERYTALKLAWVGLAGAALVCSVVFGGAGYLFAKSADVIRVSMAEKKMDAAIQRADGAVAAAEKKSEFLIAASKRDADKDVAVAVAAAKWAATDEGKLARIFFSSKHGIWAAKCTSTKWEKRTRDGETWCVPRSKPMFGWSDTTEYGWQIP
jgi:hypothetical protein